MQHIQADVVIIGGGSAGMGAYRTARQHTNSVYLIEDHHFGTTCARVGCMPSKLLIAAAEAVHHAQHTNLFGVHIDGNIRVDGHEVMQRVKSERDRFVGFVLEDVEEFDNKILGRAQFIDAHTIQVDDHTTLTAKRIVIATGSRPFILPEWQTLEDKLIVNDDVFEWDTLPNSIAVFGTGVIGLELGQALSRLGVTVHIFGRSGSLGGITDPVVLAKATTIMSEELNLHLHTKTQVRLTDNRQVHIAYEENGQNHAIEVDYLLAATGRTPNVDNLNLAVLGLETDNRGVPIANRHTMQTSIPHIFIAGDASNQLTLLHEASDQGRIAGANAGSFPKIHSGLRRSLLSVVFSDPQIAHVGARYQDLIADMGEAVLAIGQVSFHNQGRSRVMGVNKGHMRVYADKMSKQFLGAEIFGPAAEHLAHLLAWSHQQGMTIPAMLDMPFYHPVIEEGVRTALRDVNAAFAQ